MRYFEPPQTLENVLVETLWGEDDEGDGSADAFAVFARAQQDALARVLGEISALTCGADDPGPLHRMRRRACLHRGSSARCGNAWRRYGPCLGCDLRRRLIVSGSMTIASSAITSEAMPKVASHALCGFSRVPRSMMWSPHIQS